MVPVKKKLIDHRVECYCWTKAKSLKDVNRRNKSSNFVYFVWKCKWKGKMRWMCRKIPRKQSRKSMIFNETCYFLYREFFEIIFSSLSKRLKINWFDTEKSQFDHVLEDFNLNVTYKSRFDIMCGMSYLPQRDHRSMNMKGAKHFWIHFNHQISLIFHRHYSDVLEVLFHVLFTFIFSFKFFEWRWFIQFCWYFHALIVHSCVNRLRKFIFRFKFFFSFSSVLTW